LYLRYGRFTKLPASINSAVLGSSITDAGTVAAGNV